MIVKGLDYIRTARRWQRWGHKYHNEATKYYAESNKTALTIGTFLLGFIGIFLQIGNIKIESFCNKYFLSVGFVSLMISTLLGLFLFREMNGFLNKAGDYYEKISGNLYRWILKHKKAYGAEYPKEIYKGAKLTIQSDNKLWSAQLISLGIGFIGVTIYFFLRLFC